MMHRQGVRGCRERGVLNIKLNCTSKLLAAASSPSPDVHFAAGPALLSFPWMVSETGSSKAPQPSHLFSWSSPTLFIFFVAVPFPSIYIMRELVVSCLVFFLSVEQVDGLALFGRQRRSNNGTSPAANRLNKRIQQQAVLATRFSTLFVGGDPAKTRTANSGFDCRVDILNGLWGFCPATVIAATDCGLAGSCVDSFSCSKGCGFTDMPLTTFT
ncbi:hypothetical protein BT67DRAFT_36474 [Trichocladium antarcticum]|uniref:Uncharacterized protein n=1 Tax=Trichocladium antarcticum TaxID=1450529 RepID=A0AAN6UJ36_9PEZI|nr:hypothetical protein BT67DRAFT_36474 [Trichocladium antarcticum]